MTIHINETEQSSQSQFNKQVFEYMNTLRGELEILAARVDLLSERVNVISEGLEDVRKVTLGIISNGPVA